MSVKTTKLTLRKVSFMIATAIIGFAVIYFSFFAGTQYSYVKLKDGTEFTNAKVIQHGQTNTVQINGKDYHITEIEVMKE